MNGRNCIVTLIGDATDLCDDRRHEAMRFHWAGDRFVAALLAVTDGRGPYDDKVAVALAMTGGGGPGDGKAAVVVELTGNYGWRR
jgi:hypothetical protein